MPESPARERKDEDWCPIPYHDERVVTTRKFFCESAYRRIAPPKANFNERCSGLAIVCVRVLQHGTRVKFP